MVQWNPQSLLLLPLILHYGFAVLSAAAAFGSYPKGRYGR